MVRIFLYSDWIHENTDQKKTPYLDIFHVVGVALYITSFSFMNLVRNLGLLMMIFLSSFVIKQR